MIAPTGSEDVTGHDEVSVLASSLVNFAGALYLISFLLSNHRYDRSSVQVDQQAFLGETTQDRDQQV